MGEHRFDGLDAAGLAARLSLPACAVHDTVGSTMDLAHAAALRGAAAGTLIVADAQSAGRGRGGRRWESQPGRGLWMTLLERPASPRGLEVMSLRLGLALAESLDALVGERVGLKWPNDVFLGRRKLAGILVEARWRELHVDWVAIGVGMNVRAPDDMATATGLPDGVQRIEVLDAILPALRQAAAAEGPLTEDELARYGARDIARGRSIASPAVGVVAGVNPAGELMVDTGDGWVACRSGSMAFAEVE